MNTATLRIHQAALRFFADNGGTSVAVSDLAREAGLSRGTIYNNLDEPQALFGSVCQTVAEEFGSSVAEATAGMSDPAEKISAAIRLGIRRVHEDPHWGRFISRYAMMQPELGSFWGKMPADELRRGISSGRFDIRQEQIASITATAGGATFGAMTLVLEGHRTWRQAGSDTAEIILRGVGIDKNEAREITQRELEGLPRLSVFDAA